MLVLQRKKNQALLIGDNIKISILDSGADWVKLAIDAPREISVLRAELVEAAEVNQEASQSMASHTLSEVRNLLKKKNTGES